MFNVGELCVDVKWKQTVCYFDGIKCASVKI